MVKLKRYLKLYGMFLSQYMKAMMQSRTDFFVVYASSMGNISFTFGKVLAFILMALLATLIYTSIKLFFASLTFWVQRSQSILFIFYSMSDFAKYPLEIYHKFIRTSITYIVPFAVTTYFLGAAELFPTLLRIALIAALAMALGYSTFLRGMKRYESVGN